MELVKDREKFGAAVHGVAKPGHNLPTDASAIRCLGREIWRLWAPK